MSGGTIGHSVEAMPKILPDGLHHVRVKGKIVLEISLF